MANNGIMNGDELYKIAQSFINYHGQSGTDSKDEKFSVKNIKTIILSPVCLIFEYHLNIGEKPFKGAVKVPLDSSNQNFVSNCWMISFKGSEIKMYVETMKQNRALVDAIGRGTNKCQGLEEIVLVPTWQDCYLSSKDSDIRQFLEELIANKKNRTGDLVKDLYDYYPRLRCISYSDDINKVINVLRQRDIEQKSGNKDNKTLSSYNMFNDTMSVNEDGWWKTTSYSAKYPLDAKLTVYFENIKDKYVKEEKDRKIAEIHDKRSKNDEEEFKKVADKYTAYHKIYNGLYKLSEKYGIYKFDKLSTLKVINSKDDVTKDNINMLNEHIVRIMLNFYKNLYNCLISSGKYSLKVIFHDKVNLVFPKDASIVPTKELEEYGVQFNGKPNETAFLNAIVFYCEYFTTCSEKYRDVTIWKEKLKYE